MMEKKVDKSSLQQLCLLKIAEDIQFWCSDVENEKFNGYLYVVGPFDHLGSRQIQELLAILVKKKLMRVSYLQSLLHYRISSIDLSPCSYLVSDAVIHMISTRCKKLQHLAMPCNKRISIQLLKDLPVKLPNLLSLDLSGIATCTDDVLMAIGLHAKNLHVLKLRSCKKVTDYGLSYLNNCKDILEIDLCGTRCSPDGILMLLKHHQHLQSLSLESCTAKDVTNTYFNIKFLSLHNTRIRYLNLSNTNVNDESMETISKICPELSTLIFTTQLHTTSESWRHFSKFEHLKHLEMNAMDVECGNDLHLFLRERGVLLEKLHLTLADGFDTGMVAQYCPNLRDLSLVASNDLTGSLVQKGNKQVTLLEACPHLKSLNLQHSNFSDSKPLHDHYSSIFCRSVSQLETLNLADLEGVQFDFIAPLIDASCFIDLQFLDISQCKFVTVDLFMKVVQQCKKLHNLNVQGCWNVHRCDVERAQQLMKDQFRCLEIDWS